MTEVNTVVPTSRDRVFEVLADGWSYASWVVGAAHIRNVDEGWPAVGTKIHHSVGPWPLLVQDTTEVRGVDAPNFIELHARLWPVGGAKVRLELSDAGSGATRVRMIEHAERGPARLLPQAAQA